MLSASRCKEQPALQDATEGRPHSSQQHSSRRQCGHPGSPLLLLLILLTSWTCACKGAPLSSQTLAAEQDLQLWTKIHDVCLEVLSDSQSVTSSILEDICLTAMGIRPQIQGSEEKDNYKRFLFHYSKSHDSGNSDIMSSVLHPLLQLVPQLHDRRMKRFKAEEEVQGPGGVLSRGYFLFRPRNGRRSAGFR